MTRRFKPQVWLRRFHRWISVGVGLPLALTTVTGTLLLLKKEVAWIQPPTMRGTERSAIPARSFEELFAAARGVKELELQSWTDLDRVDVKPGKGIIKFVANNRWEVQVDTETAEVLQVAYRRSDLIESLHDGSFFADWTKLGIWVPTSVGLWLLWLTGLSLFILPHYQRSKRRRTAPR